MQDSRNYELFIKLQRVSFVLEILVVVVFYFEIE